MSENGEASPQPKRRATPVSEWSRSRTRLIGEQVRRFRKMRDLDIKDLVQETERLGHGLPRMTISALESGKRESVSVAEWLILSAALRVAPELLLLPLGAAETVEVLPGRRLPTDEALALLRGQTRGPGEGPIFDLSLHYDLVHELQGALTKAETLPMEADVHRQTAETFLRQLALHRRGMRARGQTPPALPENLSERGDDLTAWRAYHAEAMGDLA